jgi:hypothetical protein
MHPAMETTQIRNIVNFVVADLVRNGTLGQPAGGKWTLHGSVAGIADASPREFNSADDLVKYLTDAYAGKIASSATLRAAG